MPAAADLRLLRAAVFAAACVALAAAGHAVASSGPDPGLAPWAVLGGFLVLFVCCVPLAGRQRHSLLAVAGVVSASQAALHALFVLSHPGGGTAHAVAHAAPAPGGGTAGDRVLNLAAALLCNDHAVPPMTAGEAETLVRNAGLPVPPPESADAAVTMAAGGSDGVLALVAAFAGSISLGMVAAHAAAALLAGWLLLRGEAAVWRLVRLSARHARSVPAPLRLALALALALTRPSLLVTAEPVTGRPPVDVPHPTTATSGTVLPDTVIRRGPPAGVAQLTLAA